MLNTTDDPFDARMAAISNRLSQLEDNFRRADLISLEKFNSVIGESGLKWLREYQRRPGTGHDAMCRYRLDVRYLVELLRGDVMKIDDDRVDRGFNDAVPAADAAWVEVNEQRKPPVMTAARIAELNSRETP